jgi:hypothetical protein
MRRISSIVVLLLLAATAGAGTIILKIVATNPLDKPQDVPIRANLPGGITTNDIISTGGLDVGYDVNRGVYYVYRDATLGPKQTATYPVEIRDVWTVPDEDLVGLEQHAAAMRDKLRGTEHADLSDDAYARITNDLAVVRARQAANAIRSGAKPLDHIRAHEANTETLKTVKVLIGRMENLVLGTRQDPGRLMGEVTAVDLPSRKAAAAQEYDTALIRFTIRNPSPNQAREISGYRRELPAEIGTSDILDSDGLSVARDPKTGITVLVFPDLTIAPGDTVTYTVRVRDKWNINAPRVTALRGRAEDMLARLGDSQRMESVLTVLNGVLEELKAIEAAADEGPETLNDSYIAFHRGRAATLDALEQRLIRLETALRPMDNTTRIGFDVKAPSMKTTWLVIYIILGFLGVVSILFFLRWYGRSKAEKMDEG